MTIPANQPKQILMSHSDPSKKITTLNPVRMELAIKKICKEKFQLEYLARMGSIIVNTTSIEDAKALLQINFLPIHNAPVKCHPAWHRQPTYGKIYAPEFGHETPEDLIEYLKPNKVAGVCQLFTSPTKSNIP